MKHCKKLVIITSVMFVLGFVACSSDSDGGSSSSDSVQTGIPATSKPTGITPKTTQTPTTPSSGSTDVTPTTPGVTPRTPETPRTPGLSKSCIVIDGITLEKTEEISVITSSTSVVGAAYSNNCDGVFIAGRTVTLSPFKMGKYEVTQELYETVMRKQKYNPLRIGGTEYSLKINPAICLDTDARYKIADGEEQKYRPVEGVTWYDAIYFCNALSMEMNLSPVYIIENIVVSGDHITNAGVAFDITKNGYRLPTEAEWEFAARGGNTENEAWNYAFSGADVENGTTYNANRNVGLDAVGWYWYNICNGGVTHVTEEPLVGTVGYGTHSVGLKKANTLGLYDMSGNVWEWCYDYYGVINAENVTNPIGATSGNSRVRRGGSWGDYASSASVAERTSNVYTPAEFSRNTGFRMVRSGK